MTLAIEREKEFVNQFHYDARNYEWEKENGTPEMNLNVEFQLISPEQLDEVKFTEEDTAIYTVLNFIIPLENIVLSGSLSQLNYIKERVIKEQSEMNEEEMKELAISLFELLRRLVYETTEVALDQPGINLEF